MGVDDNKALMCRWHAEMNKHNADACDQMLADDYREQNNMSPAPLDKASAKALLAALFRAVPDMSREIIEQVGEGDAVVERLRYRGTHKAEMFGIPATGRSVEFEAAMRSRIRDGKIIEIWALMDSMSLMRQLGAIPA